MKPTCQTDPLISIKSPVRKQPQTSSNASTIKYESLMDKLCRMNKMDQKQNEDLFEEEDSRPKEEVKPVMRNLEHEYFTLAQASEPEITDEKK